MAQLKISLFGGLLVKLDEQPVNGFESNKARALLAYLATETDRPHSREKLSALLWPDMPEQAARNNLRYTLSNLRKVLGDLQASNPVLIITQQTIQLDVRQDIELDVLTFTQCLAQSPGRVADLEEAVRLYRGDFLEGFSISDDTVFEEWAILRREQFRRQALDALHRLAQACEEDGDMGRALSSAWRMVDLEPWSEEAHRYLMRLLGVNGQRSAALTQYETCRRVLAEELNVEPSLETVRLYEQIRDGEIKPIRKPQSPAGRSARKKPAKEAGPRSNTPSSASRKSDGRLARWLKVGGAGLFLLLICAVVLFYQWKGSILSIPENKSVKGKILGPCSDQTMPRLCVTDAQTGRIIQIIDHLSVDRLGPGLSWAPDGKRIVFDASTQPKQGTFDDYDLYVVNADGTDLKRITSGDDNDILPDWSPDGTWIAFHRNCVLSIIHPDGTQAKPLSFGLCATGIAWSPDGQWIAFLDVTPPSGERPSTIRVFQPGGSDARIVYTFDQPMVHGDLAWSPDGRQIFCKYDAGGDMKSTILVDANGGGALKQGLGIPVSWFHDFFPQ